MKAGGVLFGSNPGRRAPNALARKMMRVYKHEESQQCSGQQGTILKGMKAHLDEITNRVTVASPCLVARKTQET